MDDGVKKVPRSHRNFFSVYVDEEEYMLPYTSEIRTPLDLYTRMHRKNQRPLKV